MKLIIGTQLSLVVLFQWSLVASAFSPISYARTSVPTPSQSYLSASNSPEVSEDVPDLEQNELYIQGLINNLTEVLDRWVVTGSPVKVRSSVVHACFPIYLYSIPNEYIDYRKLKCKTFSIKSSGNLNHNP
jgi:hypothetical protein